MAPQGKSLISASTIGVPEIPADHLRNMLLNELREWFGDQVDNWSHLKTYEIKQAVLQHSPGRIRLLSQLPQDGLIVCGDQTENSSVNGALRSGRLAAELILS